MGSFARKGSGKPPRPIQYTHPKRPRAMTLATMAMAERLPTKIVLARLAI